MHASTHTTVKKKKIAPPLCISLVIRQGKYPPNPSPAHAHRPRGIIPVALPIPIPLSGHLNFNEMDTAFDALPTHRPPNRVSMSVPIVLPCTGFTKESLESSGMTSAALATKVSLNRNTHVL